MIRRPPRSTLDRSSAASDVYKRQKLDIDTLNETIEKFEYVKFKQEDCINQAKKFSKERFKKEMLQFVDAKLKEK